MTLPLVITRNRGFLGNSIVCRVFIDGVEVAQPACGETLTVTCPSEHFVLSAEINGSDIRQIEASDSRDIDPTKADKGVHCNIQLTGFAHPRLHLVISYI